MTNQKIYVVRKIGFQYNDDYFCDIGMSEFYDSFTDLTEAKTAFEKAENNIYRKYYLIQFLFGDDKSSSNQLERAEDFDKYLQKNFNTSIKQGEDYNSFFKIPAVATDEQIKEIRNIIKIAFHKILENEKSSQEEIRYAFSNFDEDSHINQEEYADHFFFQKFKTESAAYSAVIKKFGFSREEDPVEGFWGQSIEDISDFPELLKSYLDNCLSWELHNDYGDFIVHRKEFKQNYVEEFKGLTPLLKKLPFKIIRV